MFAYGRQTRARDATLGLVPTMGALHQGHRSLMRYARARADRVAVSIFVNPLQFDDPGDLSRYPATWEADLALCASEGVDAVYAPSAAAMYPAGYQTRVLLGPMAQVLCGAVRPGHFDGVATVCLKLFNAARPDFAVFGEKDFQQLKLVQQMVADLDLTLEVVGCPTVREPDGLALAAATAISPRPSARRPPASSGAWRGRGNWPWPASAGSACFWPPSGPRSSPTTACCACSTWKRWTRRTWPPWPCWTGRPGSAWPP